MTPFLPFAGFAPDLDPTTPGVITECENLVPTLRGYKGAASGIDVGMDALAAAAVGAAVLVRLDGTARLIAGTATKLYEQSGSTWADVSRVAAYNASTSYPWRFAQFGDTALAINKGDVLQSSSAGAFADVAGAPKAAVMCIASGFVMLANTNEATYGDSFDRWWCSAYLNVADWTPAIATQCATGRLVDSPGAITAMRTFGYDVVAYKARSMYVGRYAGPPGVWDFTLLPGEIGCASHEAIADIGSAHIFIGDEDIYLFNGATVAAIGAPLREWFFIDLDAASRYRIRHAHDRRASTVYFYYPRAGDNGELTGCIAYNYKSNKWGVAHRAIECPVDYISGGYTYDTLPILGARWDSWPQVAYDSPFWNATATSPAVFSTDHKLYSLTGAAESATLATGSYGVENSCSLLTRVTLRYLSRPTSATMLNAYRDVHGDPWALDVSTEESSGRFDVLRAAPWHIARFEFVGDFEVTGLSADVQPDGEL